MSPTRRTFLKATAVASGGLLAACTPEEPDAPLPVPDGRCDDAFADATFIEVLPFENDADRETETVLAEGHDARLLTDLQELSEDKLTQSNAEFYIRTEFPDLLDSTDDWAIRIRGLVGEEFDLALDDLVGEEIAEIDTFLLECSGNGDGSRMGLLSSAPMGGIPFSALLDRVDVDASATRVLVHGFDERTQVSTHSTPGASWIFTFDELADAGAFLCTRMNGEAVPDDHGFPVRLFVPGWYGCSCIKWVDEIRFVDDSEPATSQMQEFASRTHQDGIPAMASEFIPATIDTAAMPVRVEKWLRGGRVLYRVVGITWGGDVVDPPVSIQWGADGEWQQVTACPDREHAQTWGLWWATWDPESDGAHALNCRVDDPDIRTRRLQDAFLRYQRTVTIDEINA